MISRLVNDHGWRVGVVAQSHSVVENLLDKVVAAGANPERVGKRPKKSDGCVHAWHAVEERDYPDFVAEHDGCVIGGTAWDFANSARVIPGSLDLLVIEEAGQFCLANTIAVSPAARNLLLLGDPQQLPQVSQGTHFEPVDSRRWAGWSVAHRPSTLAGVLPGALLADAPRGVRAGVALFLWWTTRVRDDVTDARRLAGREPGVLSSSSNMTATRRTASRRPSASSPRSVLVGIEWTDEKGTRPLGEGDVLVVAAYNAHVRMIRRLLEDAGLREFWSAPSTSSRAGRRRWCSISMAASSIDDVPRGISFPAQPQPGECRGQPGEICGLDCALAALTDYLPAGPLVWWSWARSWR